MHRPRFGRLATTLALVLVVSAVSCGKTKPHGGETGGSSGGGTGGAAGVGSGGAGGGLVVPCLDRPNELPQPPTNGLPCDLIPPPLAR